MLTDELKRFRDCLLLWFRRHQRDLPWRKDQDPYRIWISEIMLQQTRVTAVIPYYGRFLARLPDVRTLAEAPQEEVLRLWSGLGYYSRARNLQRAAQQIVAKHAGEFPRTTKEVLALAGIGEYTAAAILSIAFDQPLAVLDGNVARVISRLDAVHGDLRESKRWSALQERAAQLLAKECAGDWNQAMMELGATVCTPKSPQCLLCPVAQFCDGRKLGIAESLPEKRKKRATVSVRLVGVVLRDAEGKCLILPPPGTSKKNRADDHVPSLVAKLWHFPTITAPNGEQPALNALLVELKLKASKTLRTERLERVRHTVTYRMVSVSPYLINVQKLPEVKGAKHLAIDQVLALPISNMTRKLARQAQARIEATQKQQHR